MIAWLKHYFINNIRYKAALKKSVEVCHSIIKVLPQTLEELVSHPLIFA